MALTLEQEKAIIEANKRAKTPGTYENPLNSDMVAVKDQYGTFNGMTKEQAASYDGGESLRQKALQIAEDNKAYQEADIKQSNSKHSVDNVINRPSAQQTLATMQQQQAINSLAQAQNNAQGTTAQPLSADKLKVKNNYYNEKNNANVASQLNAKSFAEFYANRGQTNAGASLQGEISRQGQLQNTMTNLNIAENQAYADIDKAEADKQYAEKLRQEDIAREQARYEQQRADQQQRDAMNWTFQQQQYNNTLQQQALENQTNKQTYDYNKTKIAQAEEDRKVQELLATMGQYSGNYKARMNEIENDGDPSNDWELKYYGTERQKKIDDAWDTYYKQGIVTADLSPIINLPVGTMTPEYKSKQDAANAKATEAVLKAERDLAWDKWTKNAPLTAREYQLLGIKPGTKYVPPKAPSSGGSSASVSQQNYNNKQNSQQLTGQIQTYLDQWASGQASDKNGQRADQNDMLNYLKTNSGTLTAQGVDVNTLIQWVKNNYTWIR